MKTMKPLKGRALTNAIDAAYKKNFSDGTEIMLMDIPKVFRAGEAANARGEDIEAAVVAFVNKIKIQKEVAA